MARVIGPKGNPKRIVDDGRSAQRTGAAVGAEVGAMTKKHLDPPLANYDAAEAAEKKAVAAAEAARATVKAEDVKCKEATRLIKDVMYNALGRPRRSAVMDLAFPRGVRSYLVGPPSDRPALLQVLVSRLGDVPTSSRLTDDLLKEWRDKLEALLGSSEAAGVALRPLHAAAMVARSSRLAAVAGVQAGLMALKREMVTFGMSEAKIHEVIPDASPRAKAAGDSTAPTKTDGGGTTA